MDLNNFIDQWKGHGYERGETHLFWSALLRDMFSLDRPEDWIVFEDQINGKYIDARIPSTRVLIEQKSIGRDLEVAFEQAKEYDNELPFDRKSRWIVCCDFQSFRIHDMNQPRPTPEIVLLKDLPREYHRLKFLIDENAVRIKRELELSLQAGELVGKLYDAFAKSYVEPNSVEAQCSLSKLCVRLVFCLYAEDAGLFPDHRVKACLERCSLEDCRRGLADLFSELKTSVGTLFDDELFAMPKFTAECYSRLHEAASFNWSGISPTIFGALFESTLNSSTRRSGGMHYTSIENIHKVIVPLFLDDLRAELEQCGSNRKKLVALQSKLGHLTFFDPACGSGNFLTETYLSLRRLENKILERLQGGAIKLGAIDDPIQVTIDQFHGIEINDFAVAVARTALWIAEHQMLRESAEIIHREIDFLPIKTNAHIVEGNALRLDWKELVGSVDFIMGNPPFVGTKYQSAEQKADLLAVDKRLKPLDYVCCWFKKAADFMIGTETRAAFVATNSITQGETVVRLAPILDAHIDFAHRSFKWSSEIKRNAAVHCVVIGFSHAPSDRNKFIVDSAMTIVAENISPYLIDAPNIIVTSRAKPLCDVPSMRVGSAPTDGGNLIIEGDDYDEFVRREPQAKKWIRRMIGADEFINGLNRYCLWLGEATPQELKRMPRVMDRLKNVRDFRLSSRKAATRAWATKPWLFTEIRQPSTNYIVVPLVSSERRHYVPMGFMPPDVIANAQVKIIPDAGLYHFGVLESSVHMAWMRALCGRLEISYRYSSTIVYNNFPWCSPTEDQRLSIECSARKILDVRSKYPDSSLAALYDELTMPDELRKAHADNDRAVLDAYGFDRSLSESEIVARLMVMYERLTR